MILYYTLKNARHSSESIQYIHKIFCVSILQLTCYDFILQIFYDGHSPKRIQFIHTYFAFLYCN